jgi:hypothetical protein
MPCVAFRIFPTFAAGYLKPGYLAAPIALRRCPRKRHLHTAGRGSEVPRSSRSTHSGETCGGCAGVTTGKTKPYDRNSGKGDKCPPKSQYVFLHHIKISYWVYKKTLVIPLSLQTAK